MNRSPSEPLWGKVSLFSAHHGESQAPAQSPQIQVDDLWGTNKEGVDVRNKSLQGLWKQGEERGPQGQGGVTSATTSKASSSSNF